MVNLLIGVQSRVKAAVGPAGGTAFRGMNPF